MISVYQAEHIVLSRAKLLSAEQVPLSMAQGRLLREAVRSDRDQPAFDKVTMDGIAIHSSVYEKGARSFLIEGTAAAGAKACKLRNTSNAIEVMTGAVLPLGCNTVIPVEQIAVEGDKAELKGWTLVKAGQNIVSKGAHGKKGQLLIKENTLLSTPHISVLASVGRSRVSVTRIPRIAIVSTGDELVDISNKPKDYQTRLSNSHALKSLIDSSGLGRGEVFHYADDRKLLLKGIAKNLKDFDIVILSGGVSMGKFDHVPGVLKELGVKELFHKVAQRPGKPFWFGETSKGKVVFALPGNPVSTLVCAYRYVIPYLRKAAGLKSSQDLVLLGQSLPKNGDLTEFVAVRLTQKNGSRFAVPVHIAGSGDFAALAEADGFIEYDQNQKSLWPYFSWRV